MFPKYRLVKLSTLFLTKSGYVISKLPFFPGIYCNKNSDSAEWHYPSAICVAGAQRDARCSSPEFPPPPPPPPPPPVILTLGYLWPGPFFLPPPPPPPPGVKMVYPRGKKWPSPFLPLQAILIPSPIWIISDFTVPGIFSITRDLKSPILSLSFFGH